MITLPFTLENRKQGRNSKAVLLPEVAMMFASALLESALAIIKEKEKSPP